jgi:uncharacterized protein
MPPVHFNVSQVRIAASCPRILYFDVDQGRRQGLKTPPVTRIWKSGAANETTACGSLFHDAIERFNRQAGTDRAVAELLTAGKQAPAILQGLRDYIYWNCLNRDSLFQKTVAQQQAFLAVLKVYVGELADILAYALRIGKPVDEILGEMFGDRRKRVDATFHVGPANEPVHITGELDYVFYDWRVEHHRIIDYKLTPAQGPKNDQFQVCVYALIHHRQHHTHPNAAVLYLHPAREMVEKQWEDIWAERGKIYDLLASMREWVRFDESTGQGLKPPGETQFCNSCKWEAQCVERLGPKEQGTYLTVSVKHEDDSDDQQDAQEPEKSEPAALAAEALWIGRTLSNDKRPVCLPCRALPTHVAVVGAAGSGKTWLAKVLAEEAILQGVPVVAIDPQGDLVQFLRQRDPAELDQEERERLALYRERVEPRILTPGTSHGIRVSLSPIRLARAAELAGDMDPQRQTEELDGILGTIAGNLVGLAKAGGEADSQQTFVLQVLKRLTAEGTSTTVSLANVVAGILQPADLGIEDADAFVKKSEREKLGRKLNNLVHGPAAHLFTGGLTPDIGELCRPVSPGKTPLNVFYLNALASDDHKQFFVAALAAEIYRWMVTSAKPAGKPSLVFYLDEARDYIPAGSAKPPAKMPLIRLFAQGRKYGVACLICTQSPRSVDYNIFGNCSTKIIGRLESAQDTDRVAEWFTQSGPAPPWLRARAGADEGSFVGRWPEMEAAVEGQVFKSRCLLSLHEGAWSPDRVEQEMRHDAVRRALQSGNSTHPT